MQDLWYPLIGGMVHGASSSRRRRGERYFVRICTQLDTWKKFQVGKRVARNGAGMADYILKLFDRELIRFSAKDTGDIPEISITHIDQDALSLMPLGMEVSDRGLARWLKHRKIPRNRAYIHSFLAKTGLSANSTMGIIDVSKGLSLNDSYWVVREGDSKNFDQCNLYDNKFSELLANIAFTGYSSSVRTSVVSSPEFTTNGMLPKCWRRQSGKIYLYKGGTVGASNTGNEPYSEYYAWQIAQILGVNAIEYNIAKWKSRLCSKCEIFTSKDISFVPVGNIVKQGGMQAVIDYYGTLDSKYRDMLEDMFVFDAVIANTDRHFGNFGFLVDAATNTLKAPAPLFDHGNSLFNFASPIEIESKDVFINFADVQAPVCYSNFFSVAKSCMKSRHREGLRHLLKFKLKKHPRYNLSSKRLKYIEIAVQKRASLLLDGETHTESELSFW